MQTLQKRSERNRLSLLLREMQCLLLRLKSRSVRKAFHRADFMGTCPAVSHTRLLYLPRRWVFLFVPGPAERNEHDR